jgi:hypothetical protein
MKKLLAVMMMSALCLPVFAKDDCAGDKCPFKDGRAHFAAHHKKDGQESEFKKARREHKAKMEATEEKVEKLVEEYNKLKPGKKKDAKKAEIAAIVAGIRDEQLKFKEQQIVQFQERLESMKKGLEEQKNEEAKQAWVNKKTDAIIADEGDLDVLFKGEMGPAPRKDGKFNHDGKKGDFHRKGPKGKHHRGDERK